VAIVHRRCSNVRTREAKPLAEAAVDDGIRMEEFAGGTVETKPAEEERRPFVTDIQELRRRAREHMEDGCCFPPARSGISVSRDRDFFSACYGPSEPFRLTQPPRWKR